MPTQIMKRLSETKKSKKAFLSQKSANERIFIWSYQIHIQIIGIKMHVSIKEISVLFIYKLFFYDQILTREYLCFSWHKLTKMV